MVSVRTRRLSALLIVPLLAIAALTACGGTKTATALPAVSATPTTATDRVQATQAAPSPNATLPATPTPLANALPTGAVRATGAATSAATTSGGTPTPLGRTPATIGTNATANTVTSSGTAARSTQATGSAPTSTSVATAASGTTSAGTSGSAVAGTGAAGPPTTTPVPATEARGSTEQFLRVVLAKGDISGYLTPALKVQTGTDGYKLLNIQPPVQQFTIDSEQRDTDGNGATVQATITTASGVARRTFVMRKQGNTWLVDNVLG